ncbi:hypothetical protein BC828DRAFT_273903 [Blastocladiella britannica]|nr:hypothetical protein BC828DRAFT_273903 [Blastocladiella britannica]
MKPHIYHASSGGRFSCLVPILDQSGQHMRMSTITGPLRTRAYPKTKPAPKKKQQRKRLPRPSIHISQPPEQISQTQPPPQTLESLSQDDSLQPNLANPLPDFDPLLDYLRPQGDFWSFLLSDSAISGPSQTLDLEFPFQPFDFEDLFRIPDNVDFGNNILTGIQIDQGMPSCNHPLQFQSLGPLETPRIAMSPAMFDAAKNAGWDMSTVTME